MVKTSIIDGAIEMVIGIALLPIMGGFVAFVSADANLSSIIGFSLLMTLIVYIFAFAIIIRGYHMIRGGK
jgi:hypothetical protein